MISNKLIIFNFVQFQLLWWVCVLSAEPGLSAGALLLVTGLTLLHLHFVEGWRQSIPLLLAALIGCLFDQVGYRMGWVDFSYHNSGASFIPLWMMALWLAFSCTLNVSLGWLQNQPLLAALLGAIFGPLAYWGAQQLGVVILSSEIKGLVWVACEWAIALPLLLAIRTRFNQTQ